ncbi:glycosyltransferase family 1 protein [Bacteroides sp.]|uniref:glycosyltransferase family 4 protein n=1 Tax=Bacteroides sp. TaxID=29523 RepID=UPI002607C945|nr:glycosyltransferase family 1 protein [Bacteroides sp.]MDD3037273.1 glycosyltransferase family 1 protein [Bacteroides sp.]
MIYFDNIIFSLQRTGGISVVWYELLKRYIASHGVEQYRIIESRWSNKNMLRKLLEIPNEVSFSASILPPFIDRYFDLQVSGSEDFLFHSSYYRVCGNRCARNITTVHDFTYEYYCKGWRKTLHCQQKYQAIRQSELAICISENTRQDLLRFVPDYPPERIRVVYNGISDSYKVLLPGLGYLSCPYSKGSFVLYVGARDSYKKFDLVVQGLADLDLCLVIVGSPLTDNEQHMLLQYLGKERYYYTGNITNDELNVLYNNAYALLYPSAYEGFGLPVLEAQSAGCPVVAYRSSSIPEIIGTDRLLMNHLTVKELTQKLKLLENSSFRESVINEGLHNSSHFSWDNMYTNIREIYDEVSSLSSKKKSF